MIGGGNCIAPSKVAQDFIEAMEKDIYEIRVGKTQDIYELLPKVARRSTKVDATRTVTMKSLFAGVSDNLDWPDNENRVHGKRCRRMNGRH